VLVTKAVVVPLLVVDVVDLALGLVEEEKLVDLGEGTPVVPSSAAVVKMPSVEVVVVEVLTSDVEAVELTASMLVVATDETVGV